MSARERSNHELQSENAELKRVCLLLLRKCESARSGGHGGSGDLLEYTPELRRAARQLTNGLILVEDFDESLVRRSAEKTIIKSIVANAGGSHV